MKVKIIKDLKHIKVFVDDKELKYVKSFSIKRTENEVDTYDLTLSLVSGNIEFIDLCGTNKESSL